VHSFHNTVAASFRPTVYALVESGDGTTRFSYILYSFDTIMFQTNKIQNEPIARHKLQKLMYALESVR